MSDNPLAQYYLAAAQVAHGRMGWPFIQQPESYGGMLGGFQAQRGLPNKFDNMVVPPYDLPPDRNTYMPDDVMQRRAYGYPQFEDI